LAKVSAALWSGGEEVSFPRMLAVGSLIWGAYTAIQLAASGIVLDQVVVPVQIITGTVPYPPGHPHQIFYSQAFSLLNYVTAAIWHLKPDSQFISCLRNFLFLFLSVFVPFGLGVILTRRPLWGYLAVTIAMSQTAIPFGGLYPLFFWPHPYSDGHIGAHLVLLLVILLLAGLWKWAGLLLGLLPGLHAAMCIVGWPWAACYVGRIIRSCSRTDKRHFFASICLGLTACVGLGLLIWVQKSKLVAVSPYDVKGNEESIYRLYTSETDAHRQLPPLLSYGYLVNTVALFAIGALALRAQESRKGAATCVWILLLGGLAWAYVYSAWLFQAVFGRLPDLWAILMPARFSNISALLLIPISVAAVAGAYERMPEGKRLVATVAVASLVCAEGLFIRIFPDRIASYLMFALWGLAFAMNWYVQRSDLYRLRTPSAAVAVTLCLMFWTQRSLAIWVFGLTLFTFGFVLFVAGGGQRSKATSWNSRSTLVLLAACAITIAVVVPGTKSVLWDRDLSPEDRWDRFTAFDRLLTSWLETHVDRKEPILAPIYPRTELQVKTGHPVVAEMETLQLISYIPKLAPVVGMMSKDLYDVNYEDRVQLTRIRQMCGGGNGVADIWKCSMVSWQKRNRADWQVLAKKYRFRLVLSPANATLDLPVAVQGRQSILYLIP
jgi:uncharacterized membrane protein YidH (DUF202 family)